MSKLSAVVALWCFRAMQSAEALDCLESNSCKGAEADASSMLQLGGGPQQQQQQLHPKMVMLRFLANTDKADVLREIIAPDATYVSLNFKNENLTRIMPWCGTHNNEGPQGVIETFRDVAQFWKIDAFEPQVTFCEEENCAVFGSFTYTSTVLQKQVTSPFAIQAKVRNGKITYMMFMEDTLMTSSSFAKSGTRTYVSNPHTLEEVTF